MFNELVRPLVKIKEGVSGDLSRLRKAVAKYPISTYSFAEVNPDAARKFSDHAAESGDPDLQREYIKAFHERHNWTVGDLTANIINRLGRGSQRWQPDLTGKSEDI